MISVDHQRLPIVCVLLGLSPSISDLLLIACKKKQEVLNRPLRSRLKVRQGNILESRERAAFQKDVSPYRGDVT